MISPVFKSAVNPMFRSHFAETIFNNKYRHEGSETWERLSDVLVEDVCQDRLSQDDKDQLKQYIRELKFIPGGRYLYYAGRPNKYFNNCYLLKAEDDTREDWAELSKRSVSCLMTGGGIGANYSVYREKDSIIGKTGGLASGPIPKMIMTNEEGRQVMQGGSRRSAIYASLNWKHGDIQEFLRCKNWHEMKVAGTNGLTIADLKKADFNYHAPLDMTNISINYDTSWIEYYRHTRQVGSVFRNNVVQAISTAEPGFSFNFYDKENETLRNACVTGDTLILTRKGYLPIKNCVDKRTEVWNGTEWSFVKPFSTGVNSIMSVKLSNGVELKCTDYHKWILSDGRRVPTDKLVTGDKLYKYSMPVVDSEMKMEVDPYSQGFYSGDGNTGYNHSWLYGEKYHLCASRLCGTFNDYDEVRKKGTWKHGPMMDKSFVPLNFSVADKLNWLAGICDSDGTVTRDKNGNGIQIVAVDHQFLRDIRMMLTTLGVQSKICTGNLAGLRSMPDGKGGLADYQCQETKRLLIGNMDVYSLIQLGFKCNRLKLHGNRPQRDARKFVTIVSIEYTGQEEETYCFNEPKNHTGTFNGIVTGQCCEVTSEDDSDVCNLGSINMGRIESIQEFNSIIELAIKFLMCGTLVAQLPYQKVYDVREKNRRLGLGLMGIHEWLLKRKQPYEVTADLHEWLATYKLISSDVSKQFSEKLGISCPKANRAIAPTGTIGILAGTTTGIEPLFAVAYKRMYLKDGTNWHYQYVIDSVAQELIDVYGLDPDKIDSAVDLATNYERRIKFQADVQDYVDMAISSTINLPKWGSPHNNEDTVDGFCSTLANYAHRLRGFTCYPDGARGGQPLTPVTYRTAMRHLGKEFEEHVETHDICDITGKSGTCGS